jgi:hypothetical protein
VRERADVPDGRGSSGAAAVGAFPGSRLEIRRRLREQRRLRVAVLVMVSLLVLGALPLYFGVRAAARDPVFTSLDALNVPGWAASKTVDDVSGSRWCLMDCRLRERTVESQRAWQETATVYETALSNSGWRPWQVALCPGQQVKGHYTCWRRDELTLDLWVRPPTCAGDVAPSPPAVQPPAKAKAPTPATGGGKCGGSVVSLKVRNAIGDDRTKPQPSTDTSVPGVDPNATDNPLGHLTPSPS